MRISNDMKRVSILGSTGSIGKQALEVIRLHKLSVTALAAHSNIKLWRNRQWEFKPGFICIYNEDLKGNKDQACGYGCKSVSRNGWRVR